MNILVIAEHYNVSIRGATRHAVMAAAQIVMFTDAQVHLAVIGDEAAQAAQAGAHVAGVAQVIHLGGAQFAHDGAQELAAQFLAIAPAYGHILVAATPWGRLIAHHLAVELGVMPINEIVSIESADTFGHATHAGRETAAVQSKDRVKILTVRTSRFEAAPATGGSATVQRLATASPGRPAIVAARGTSCAASGEQVPYYYGPQGVNGAVGEGAAIVHAARPFVRGDEPGIWRQGLRAGAPRSRSDPVRGAGRVRGALDSLNPGF